jgi:hypothetical protein
MELALPPDFKEFLKLLKEIDLENLKKNKKASGRPKDIADLEKLP